MSQPLPPISVSSGGGKLPSLPPLPPINFRPKPRVEHQDTGFGSFVGNFIEGAEQFVTSLPAYAIRTATQNPLKTAAETATGFYEFGKSFTPLVRAGANLAVGDKADAAKFYDQYEQAFYANPFGPTLAILTAGRGVGGRIGAVRGLARGIPDVDLREPGMATKASARSALTRAVLLGQDTGPFVSGPGRFITVELGKDIEGVGQKGEKIVTRNIRRSHFAANRAYAVDWMLKALPADTPLLGEFKRAARATRAKGRVRYLRLLSAPEYIAYQKTGRALTKTESVAAGLRNKIPFEADVDTWREKLSLLGTDVAEATLRQLRDPKVMALYVNASKRILAHEAAGTALEPIRREVMLRTGALTTREAEASPWRLTRQLRGAHLATPSWIYKQRRKVDAEIRRLVGQKGRLVPAAKAFGNKDRRAALKAARAASNAAIRESRFRAQVFEELSKEPKLSDVPPVPEGHTRLYREGKDGKWSTRRGGGKDLYYVDVPSKYSGTQPPDYVAAKAKPYPKPEPEVPSIPKGMPKVEPPPDIHPEVTDVTKEVDDAYDQVEALEDDIDMVLSGEMTTAFLDKWGMTPAGGWGKTEQAMAEAVHKALLKEHTDELKELERLLKLAKQRKLSTRQLDEMGLRIPSDIRKPTTEELSSATEKRVYMETLAKNLKANKKKLNAEETARVQKRIDDLRAEISTLEAPKHIKRSPSSTKRRFESRYLAAERKLQKQIAKKKKVIDDIGDEVGFAGEDPREYQRIAVMGMLERRHRKAVIRYERAVAAEQAHNLSVMRGLDALERQTTEAGELKRIRDLKIQFIQAQRLRLEHLNDAIEDQVALRDNIQASLGELVGGGEPWELAGEARLGNRPIPYYTPDEMLKLDKRGRMGLSEGSILAPRLQADIYRSRSILMRTGQLALHPDTLSPAYFRAAKHDLNTEMHNQAMKLATKVAKNTPLPTGYEFLRRTRGETISETAKYRGEHLSAMEHQFGREEDLSTADVGDKDIDFTDADGSEYRLVIPKRYADEFRSEGLRSQGAIGKIFTKSMDVWRSLVLHLRVPWLINNVVGNTFLFAMRFAGAQGLAEFARMVASNPLSRKYIPAMRKLALQHLDDEQVRQIFPEQVRGTHFETQAPELPNVLPRSVRDPLEERPAGKRVVQTLSDIPRYLPRADKAYERKLRRAATNMVLRGSPEVRSIYKDMKRQGTDDFHAAVTKAIEGDPNFRDYVVQEVNDALGNFLSLTRAERSLLRRVVPFYAWMREITRISGRTLADHPARVLVLQQMAQVAAEMQPGEIPDYMRGTVLAEKAGWLGALLGGESGVNRVAGFSLRGMSPYTTLADEYAAGRALFPGGNASNVRELAGNFNPAISGLYNTAVYGGEGNVLARYAEELGRSVPQAQLLFPYGKHPLTPGRGRLDILAKLAGYPGITYDPREAKLQQFEGR